MKTRNAIPPERSDNLWAYLSRIVRSLSFDRLRAANAKKRDAVLVPLSEEPDDCFGGGPYVCPDGGRLLSRKDPRRTLQRVELPDSQITVGTYAFKNCTCPEEVEFGAGLKYLDQSAFANTALTSFSAPPSLVEICSSFQNCVKLKTADLSGASVHVGFYAFPKCTALSSKTRRTSPRSAHNASAAAEI